ncbi:uncharacterized protein LOC127717935 [Mytilus californianus]|uniref:uncharacterized protein LOC127717935 n=1 Tax=Mytilus californianus TaxID=6549 RepID=UPI002245B77C|nr:uncharacterized protein LOC127717935 [Mytilus californianus]
MEVCRDRVCLLIVLINPSLADVILRLPTDIELGKPLVFNCEISNIIPTRRSRQWRGGIGNKLLCYDGISVDPTKYKERKINQTNYELIVKETSESDLQCQYACLVGFESDQKFLEVNETNFLQLPDEHFTKMYYQMQNGKYSLKLILRKVFPKPVCELKMKEANINIPVADLQRFHVLLDVTYVLDLSDKMTACGKVECQLRRKSFLVRLENSATCNPPMTSQDSKTPSIVIGVGVSCIIVFGLFVSWVIVKRCKGNDRLNDENIRHTNEDSLMI